MRIQEAEAADLARGVLVFLAADIDRLGRFLAVTGIGPAEIRERVDDRAFLAGILDYILSDEPLLLIHAEEAGVSPESFAAARQALPGAVIDF